MQSFLRYAMASLLGAFLMLVYLERVVGVARQQVLHDSFLAAVLIGMLINLIVGWRARKLNASAGAPL